MLQLRMTKNNLDLKKAKKISLIVNQKKNFYYADTLTSTRGDYI